MSLLTLEELRRQFPAAYPAPVAVLSSVPVNNEPGKDVTKIAQTPVAVVPEWTAPSHEEVPLHKLDQNALGLDPFNDDDLKLIDAIEVAKHRNSLTPFERRALPLIARGLKVAPAYPKQKKIHTALCPEPLKMQSSDPAQVRAWSVAEPDANVVVYAEQVEGGIVIVDVDGFDLAAIYKQETGNNAPCTYKTQSTPPKDGQTVGKQHWYFWQTLSTRALAKNIVEGETNGEFSLRVKNFYVVAEGSVHPVHGGKYTAVSDTPITSMPEEFLVWLVGRAHKNSKTGDFTKNPDGWVNEPLVHGNIDNQLTKLAGHYIRNHNVNDADMLFLLLEKHCETAVDRDGVTPFACDMRRVREIAEDKVKKWKTGEEIGGKIELTQTATHAPVAESGAFAVVKKMSSFQKKKVNWLWKNRVPFGFLCTLAGDPDEGKSLITLYIAARVSRGEKLYDNTEVFPAADVLILSAEDDPESTLAPRLEAAGADMDKVHLFESVLLKDGAGKTTSERSAQLDTDIQMLDKVLIDNPAVKVVIIDPISSFLGTASIVKEQEVRRVLAPLVKRARLTGLAVILVAHFNKNSETRSAMDRVGGAKAIVGMGRSAWTCVREPKKEPKPGEDDSMPIEGPERRLFLKLKNNLAPSKIGGLVYVIEEMPIEVEGDNGPELTGTPYIHWLEGTDHLAQDVLIGDRTGRPGRPNKAEAVKDWLRNHLEQAGGYASADSVLMAAKELNYGDQTIRRAREKLRLEQGWVRRQSHWALPGRMPKPGSPMAEPEAVPKPVRKRRRNTVDLERNNLSQLVNQGSFTHNLTS